MVLPNIALIGIILPLIKVQIKNFKNLKQMVCWAWKFNKLSSKTSFIFFWNVLVPQIIVLLQYWNNKQKIKKEKDSNKRKIKSAGGYLQTVGRLPLFRPAPWAASVRARPFLHGARQRERARRAGATDNGARSLQRKGDDDPGRFSGNPLNFRFSFL